MVRRLRLSMGLLAFVLVLVPGGPPAMADPGPTIWVSHDAPGVPPTGTSCANPGYNSIQAAVTAAPPGSRINVCPGTYTEQVVIPSGKDNLTLRSIRLWQAIIQAPPTIAADVLNFKAIVRVAGARNTTLLAFTITGPGPGGCDSLRYGVRVDSAGSANIYGNHIIDIRDLPAPPLLSGCQNGVAILVGRRFEMTTGSANIVGNVIERYQKNGPTVSNKGSSAYIAANRVLGVGSTPTIAQNGIQASAEATALIEHNFVAHNLYRPYPQSTGILLYQHGNVRVRDNNTADNDFGIFAELSAPGYTSTIEQNLVQTSTSDGVVVYGSSAQTLNDNDTLQNGGLGIDVTFEPADPPSGIPVPVPSTNNTVVNNDVDRNKGGGILLDDLSSNNNVRTNHVRSNGTSGADTTDGLRAAVGATNNTIQSNFMMNNVTHDCHDDSVGAGTAGTANFWINDIGQTQNRPGLCRPAGGSEERDDNAQRGQVAMNAGWNPALPWYSTDALAAEYSWPAAYSTVDTQSILNLLAELAAPHPPGKPTPADD